MRLDRRIKAGQYAFRLGTSVPELLRLFARGMTGMDLVTIPEGLMLAEISLLLSNHLGVPIASFDSLARARPFLDSLGIEAPSLEGYLAPDSYEFLPGTPPEVAFRTMVRRTQSILLQAVGGRDSLPLGLSLYQVLPLATIVEAEAQKVHERPRIARVYLNRLERGMRLQADPPVGYALGRVAARAPLPARPHGGVAVQHLPAPGGYLVEVRDRRLLDALESDLRPASRLRVLNHLYLGVAHDLKGPGARMEELARLLAQKFPGQIDNRTARWLQLLQDNGRDIVRRVEGILSVARVGAGQGSVTAVDPRPVIDEVLNAQAGDIEQLHAIIHVEPSFPLVACHGAYLRQVFDNLISNALKYARPGAAPTLTISSQTGKHMVCFTVQDRGIGVPEKQRARVFQPFVRLRQADAPGSGIGLAIVQRIVELYGGRVP